MSKTIDENLFFGILHKAKESYNWMYDRPKEGNKWG